MRGGWTRDDAGLEWALTEAVLAARAVPPQFRVAARAAYDWRTLDAELATLTRDCATVPWTRRTGREDVAELRDLTFVAADLTVEVELGAERLLGQVVPPGPGRGLGDVSAAQRLSPARPCRAHRARRGARRQSRARAR